MLAKRTTDEGSPGSREDVNEGTTARKGPVTYTSVQLTTLREQYNAASRASQKLRYKLQKAKKAGREVSQNDEDELSRLSVITQQRRVMLARARRGQPLEYRTRYKQDIASLKQEPDIQELARTGDYTAQQLAEYKRSYLDAMSELKLTKGKLAKVAKVREVTEAEKKELANLQQVYNHHRTVWDRVRENKPADYRVDRPKKSMDDLLGSAKLLEIAQSSGYSVNELAEAQRRYLDSNNKANAFKRELADVEGVRKMTPEEKAQLQTLLRDGKRQKRVFDRMCQGKAADGRAHPPRKDVASLLKDPEMQRVAQLGGYSLEEVAVQYRGYLDAGIKYRAALKLISGLEEEGGTLNPDEEARYLEIDKAYQLQKTGWDRMKKHERVDAAIQPPPNVGRLGQDIIALRKNRPATQPPPPAGRLEQDVAALQPNEPAPHSVTYTAQQIAMDDQQHLAALDE
ncbi:MAG: hypothetical protein M1826_000898 [Phylliscum demangeonii]|nr:MAG: hypothetical protein M1826_000898 [Phylliscum demangeonii]